MHPNPSRVAGWVEAPNRTHSDMHWPLSITNDDRIVVRNEMQQSATKSPHDFPQLVRFSLRFLSKGIRSLKISPKTFT